MPARPIGPDLRQRALVPVLVFIGTVVAVISSLGAPLVPTIADVDHVSLTDAQWSLTITLLVGSVATPVMGRLGDGPHRRRVVLGAIAWVCRLPTITARSTSSTPAARLATIASSPR